jgi:hypothetical protein
MGKRKGTSGRTSERTITDPATGKVETISGTKAGKKRQMLPAGHPRRTHDRGAKRRDDA